MAQTLLSVHPRETEAYELHSAWMAHRQECLCHTGASQVPEPNRHASQNVFFAYCSDGSCVLFSVEAP